MKRYFLILVFTAFMCVSCAAYVGPYGAGVAIGPPPIDHSYYLDSRGGPPRDHYPKDYRHNDRRYDTDWRRHGY
jgi:hypothetical protein